MAGLTQRAEIVWFSTICDLNQSTIQEDILSGFDPDILSDILKIMERCRCY